MPEYKHAQDDILSFMQNVYALNEVEKRKLRFLYRQSAIDYRYSTIPDYSLSAADWQFYPATENLDPFPTLESRMDWYQNTAAALSINAVEDCLAGKMNKKDITHLITVSCTGMAAPGLDLQVTEMMGLPENIFRTSVNFMGCYAAIHAMKIADAICRSNENARVVIVCTELCTLHFQKEKTQDNLSSSLLFGDGSAAMLMVPKTFKQPGPHVESFYSRIGFGGKEHMSWTLSSSGFLMSLSAYIPELIEQDFHDLLKRALSNCGLEKSDVTHWCIHPGGKRILAAIAKSAGIADEMLCFSDKILSEYGNMSSPTILFVLKEILKEEQENKKILGAAFGPGLTMETFVLNQNGT